MRWCLEEWRSSWIRAGSIRRTSVAEKGVWMRRCLVVSCVVLVGLCLPELTAARVLRVGTYHGSKGQYRTIQAAVKAAKPGDWILIGPGDYKSHSSSAPT